MRIAGWTLLACALLLATRAAAQDRDGDHILDSVDFCPDAAEGDAPLFAGDGCPDVDTDDDGVVDDYDVCPGAAETRNHIEDADGCPDAVGTASALADPRRAAHLETVLGRWIGDGLVDLDVAASARDSQMAVHGDGPSWAGPAGAVSSCYATRVVDDRNVLVCGGPDRDTTIVWRVTDPDTAIGFVEVRTADGVQRAGWTAHRVGVFDQQAVVRMITTQRRVVQACYERELRRAPTLAGRLTVQLTVEPSGETDRVQTLADPRAPAIGAIGQCVAGVIDEFVFRPGPMGRSVSFTFPFVFEPQH